MILYFEGRTDQRRLLPFGLTDKLQGLAGYIPLRKRIPAEIICENHFFDELQ